MSYAAQAMRARLWLGLAGIGATFGACDGDLFHGTEWSSRCDVDPGARDCTTSVVTTAGPSSSSKSSVSSTTSGGGEGGGTTSTLVASGGAGGEGGGTGGEGGAMCITCADVLQTPNLEPTPGGFCTVASSDLWTALRSCACDTGCTSACAEACSGMQLEQTCTMCVSTTCSSQLSACNQDD